MKERGNETNKCGSNGDLMKIEITGFLELSESLADIMVDMEIEPTGFFEERLEEAVKILDERISNELRILTPCLTSYLSLEVMEDRG